VLEVLKIGRKTEFLGTLRELLRKKREHKSKEAPIHKLKPEKTFLLCDRNGSENENLFESIVKSYMHVILRLSSSRRNHVSLQGSEYIVLIEERLT
jgi:hypothetical protein